MDKPGKMINILCKFKKKLEEIGKKVDKFENKIDGRLDVLERKIDSKDNSSVKEIYNKNIQAVFDQLRNLEPSINNMKNDIRDILESEKISELEEKLEQAKQNEKALTSKKDELEAELEKMNQAEGRWKEKEKELEKDLEKEKDRLKNQIKQAGQDNEVLTSKKDELEAELDKMKQAEGRWKDKEKELEEEKERLKKQLKQAEQDKKVLTSKKEELEAELGEMKQAEGRWKDKEKDLEKEKTQLAVQLSVQTDQAAAARDRWNTFTKDYQELMSFIYQCPSLQDIITKAAMEEEREDADTMENMLKFIGVIGTGTSFAQDIYNVMRSYKKMNLQYLTEAERSFIIRLNQYYKKTLAVEFDVLDIPEEGKFESVSMQDIARPTAPYRNMSGVYVPGLRSDQKTFKQKAIVQGVKGC